LFIDKCTPSLGFRSINLNGTPQMKRKHHTTNHLKLSLEEVHTDDSVIDFVWYGRRHQGQCAKSITSPMNRWWRPWD